MGKICFFDQKKITMLFLSILASLFVIELALRLGGSIFLVLQRKDNSQKIVEGTYKILTLGESTTAGLQDSWPSQLEKALNQKNNKIRFKVFNEGIMGSNTAFIAARLQKNINRYKPDMVITMMGINDEFQGITMKYDPSLKTKIQLFINDFRIVKIISRCINLLSNTQQDLTVKTEANKRDSFEGQWGNDPISELVKNGDTQKALEIIDEDIQNNQTNFQLQMSKAQILWKVGRIEDAKAIYTDISQHKEVKADALYSLALIYYYQEKNTQKAIELVSEAIDNINESSRLAEWMYISLGEMYISENKIDQAIGVLETAVQEYPGRDYSLNLYAKAMTMKNNDTPKVYSDGKISLKTSVSQQTDITRYHYNYLSNILRDQKIAYVAMQYPTRPIETLYNIFDDPSNIIFVSNQNFADLVKNEGYDKYFLDNFARNFGHTTPLGSKIIAENVAKAIIDHLGIE
ncbi:hypothetical protein KBD45_03945 [Candidatus Dojkabacteria bacterium]|nr:hypothetical protein [Candidatus Dojkabacteria bacterium]